MEWKDVKLGDILNFRRGHDLPHSEMKEGSIPVAGSNGIIGYHNVSTPIQPVLTIGRSGNIGTPFIYDTAWAHNTTLYVDDFKGNNPLYLYYLCKTIPFANYKGGSAVPTLNRNHIHPLEVKFCPDVSDQTRIANILSSLDAKIENNNKINANLEAQAAALFKSWFVDFEPFKDGEFVESELGMIPKGWKVGTLLDYNSIVMGQSPSGSSYNEEQIGCEFYQGCADFGLRFPRKRVYTTEPNRYAESNSVLMSVRAPVGTLNVARHRCCIGRGLASIKSNIGCDSYTLYLMKSIKNILDTFNGDGTVFGSINKKSLVCIKVIVPSLSVIKNYEAKINPLDSYYRKNSDENQHLSSLRDTLLPKLMSGEIEL